MISRDPSNWERPGNLSQEPTAAKSASPKFWELLRGFGLKATFFVPGWTAKNTKTVWKRCCATSMRSAITVIFTNAIDPDFPDREREALEKGLEAFADNRRALAAGYRSPAGETSANLVELLAEHKFLYDSSLQDDVNPYQLRLASGAPGPIEILGLEPGRRPCFFP